MATSFDLTGDLTDSATIDDPDAVTLAGPVDCRGQVAVTRGGTLIEIHTFSIPDSPLGLPADWFEDGDEVAVERWDE